jgi:hypothetical protein
VTDPDVAEPFGERVLLTILGEPQRRHAPVRPRRLPVRVGRRRR